MITDAQRIKRKKRKINMNKINIGNKIYEVNKNTN